MKVYSIDDFLRSLTYRKNTIIKYKKSKLYTRWINERLINELIEIKKDADKLIEYLNYSNGCL